MLRFLLIEVDLGLKELLDPCQIWFRVLFSSYYVAGIKSMVHVVTSRHVVLSQR